ncbi:uncharacterized protein LOC134280592, partial [Saccostrea cucullata]|uniref:uncharacterized protein LOC134280592 n=1 Tax=Saccostrea cuccullata TaxID=36930 RepID=UPI002ED65BA7
MSYFSIMTLLILLCYPKYTSGLFGPSATDCEADQFWGNCNKDALCLCYTGLWYSSSVSSISEIMPSVNSFNDVCTCSSGSSIQKCIYPHVHQTVVSLLLSGGKMTQS